MKYFFFKKTQDSFTIIALYEKPISQNVLSTITAQLALMVSETEFEKLAEILVVRFQDICEFISLLYRNKWIILSSC